MVKNVRCISEIYSCNIILVWRSMYNNENIAANRVSTCSFVPANQKNYVEEPFQSKNKLVGHAQNFYIIATFFFLKGTTLRKITANSEKKHVSQMHMI